MNALAETGAVQRVAPTTPLAPPPGVPLHAPLHPGRFLDRHYLRPLAISQTRAARLLGVSRRRLHELVSGERGMSADTAIRCALTFGASAGFWLQLQSNWDVFHAWRAMRAPVFDELVVASADVRAAAASFLSNL